MAVGSYSYKIELIVGTMFRLLVEDGWVLLQKKRLVLSLGCWEWLKLFLKNELMAGTKFRLLRVVGCFL